MSAVIVTAIVIATVTLVLWRFQRGRNAAIEFKSTTEMMQYLAAEAVRAAEEKGGIKLDYTTDSIEKAEEVLGDIHEEYKRTKSLQGIQGLAMMYGAYIGEVIRRNEPNVKWERDDPIGGEKSYPLHWRSGRSYVCAWCYRRITKGEEDNVWHKYVAIKNQVWKNPDNNEPISP